MQPIPIRTTVIGSYPFPGWLEFATHNLSSFGAADIEEMIEDAVIAAIHVHYQNVHCLHLFRQRNFSAYHLRHIA